MAPATFHASSLTIGTAVSKLFTAGDEEGNVRRMAQDSEDVIGYLAVQRWERAELGMPRTEQEMERAEIRQ